jgi:putative peptidoglycan lipid II flippase
LNRLSRVTRATFLVASLFLVDKVLALGRSIIIAREFSLSVELDSFNVANNLPDLLFALISGGALAMAFIPILTGTLTLKGREAFWDLFSRVANLAFVATAALALLIGIFSEQIVRSQIGIAPGFGPAQQALIADLMRLNLVATLIFSISGLVIAGLQANQHFLLPALAPIFYNLGQIFGALVLAPSKPITIGPLTLPAFGLGVHGLVYGVILGAVLHLAIQIPGLVRYGFRWTPKLEVHSEGVRQVLRVFGPRLLTMFGIQLTFIARDNFASRLGQVGAVSSLTYGWMIMQVPETLLGTAIATAMLPTISERAARGEWAQFREMIERALRVLIALTLPAAVIMAIAIRPLVQVAFGFNQAQTQLLSTTATVYMLTLTGYAVQEVLARAFYARQEAWVPFWSVLIRLGAYLGMALFMLLVLPNPGAPALAFCEMAVTVESIVMLVWLNRRLAPPVAARDALVRGGAAALLGGIAGWAAAGLLAVSPLMAAAGGMLVATAASVPFVLPYLRLLLRL